jgi:hypothetical protein
MVTPLHQRTHDPGRVAGAPASGTLDADHRRLCAGMKLLKRARFNAQNRYETMATLSLASISMFSLYLIAVSVHTTLFAESISSDGLKLLTFLSIILSVFIMIVTFIVEMRGYRTRAEAMQKCAMQVSRMLQVVEIRRGMSLIELTGAINAYNDVIDACPFNHDDIDFRVALAEQEHSKVRSWASWTRLRAVRVLCILKACWLYASLIALPPFAYVAFVS